MMKSQIAFAVGAADMNRTEPSMWIAEKIIKGYRCVESGFIGGCPDA